MREATWLNLAEATLRPSVDEMATLRPDLLVEANQRPQSSKREATLRPNLEESA